MSNFKYDVFISHAFEDKEPIVRALAEDLSRLGCKVWYDEFTLKLGDSLSRSIDRGLYESKYGLVILSPAFFRKRWTEWELRGLVSRELNGEKVILPVWYGVTAREVMEYSPTLADMQAADASALPRSELLSIIVERVKYEANADPLPKASPQRNVIIDKPFRLEMVLIPEGEFLIGSDPAKDTNAGPHEQPQHRVRLSEFYISSTLSISDL